MQISYAYAMKKDLSYNLKPVYLLYGQEEKLKEEMIDKLTSEVLSPETKEYNVSVIEHKRIKEENTNILSLLNNMPFMAKMRVVIIKDVEKLDKKEEERLIQYLNNPSPYSLLILVISEHKRKVVGVLSSPLENLIKKIGVLINCSFSSSAELKNWVNNKITGFGKKIERSALDEFIGLTGSNIFQLSMELDKIISFVGERNLITKQDIETVVIPHIATNIFRLVDAIGEKSYDKALDCLMILLHSGEKTAKILNMISRQFRLLFQIKTLRRRGYISGKSHLIISEIRLIPEEIRKLLPSNKENILRQPSFVIENCLNQEKKFQEGEIYKALDRLLQTDLALKGIKNPQESKLALELLILDLCQKERSMDASFEARRTT